MKPISVTLILSFLATTGYGQGAPEVAVPAQAPAAPSEPAGALEWFKQGVELTRSGEQLAALARFKRAAALSPQWALPHLEIAVAHMMTDNDRVVIGRELAEAARLGDELPRAHHLYGIYLQETNNRPEAIRHLVRALQLRPSLEDARFRLATLYIEEGMQAQGLQQYEQVLQQRPAHLGAHRNLAVLLEQAGQLEEAERHLKVISDMFPANAYYLTDLARFYERVGWKDKAKLAHQKAEKVDPARDRRLLRPLPKSRDMLPPNSDGGQGAGN